MKEIELYFVKLIEKINLIPIENSYIILSGFVVSLILFHFFKNRFFIFFIITFPATFFHELSHYLVSFLLNGRPDNFNVVPKRTEEGWTLGSVSSYNSTWYNQPFIALAPFLLLVFGVFFLEIMILSETDIYLLLFKAYILANLIEGSIPSSTDFRLAMEKPYIVIMLFVGGFFYITPH